MSRLSLEYSIFAYGDDEVTADAVSDLVVRLCMQRGDYTMSEDESRAVAHLVNAVDDMRCDEDGDEKPATKYFTGAAVVEDEFNRLYSQVCKAAGHYCDTECSAWVEGWPTDCRWHKTELLRLARLVAGRDEHVRRQLRAEFLKHRGESDA
jgi:hypothetical protein